MMRRLALVLAIVLASVLTTVTLVTTLASRTVLRALGDNLATERLVTGLLVTGRPGAVVIYASSSDPRIGQIHPPEAHNIDTNSGVISRLEEHGGSWQRTDLVRGLPRSRADHATNGLASSADGSTLFVAQGSNTNRGAPSPTFFDLPEYALSGAILAVDLRKVRSRTIDLNTLDDPSRPGTTDDNDPFGGNGGANQAQLDQSGYVRVFAPGLRNPYDLVLTRSGRLYATQNGPNTGQGASPTTQGGRCTNRAVLGGERGVDSLDLIVANRYYGHPNPTRAGLPDHAAGRASDPRQCFVRTPSQVHAVATFASSTNGVAEYRARSLGGKLDGALVTVGLAGEVRATSLSNDGATVVAYRTLAMIPSALDVTTPTIRFPGTIWVSRYSEGPDTVVVLEPLPSSADPRSMSATSVAFRKQTLHGIELRRPTSLQFGPDGRLYVAEQSGAIMALTIVRRGGAYTVIDSQTISALQSIRNHNDDGAPADGTRHLVETVWSRIWP